MTVAFESHLITCKPWRLKLTILIGGNRQELFDAFRARKVSVKESNENADFLMEQKKFVDGLMITTNSKPAAVFVYFPCKPAQHDAHKVDTISHELLHVTFYMMNRCGVKFSNSSEEAFCHAHGQIMCEFWSRVFPRRTGSK